MDAEIETLRNENNYNLYAYCNNDWINYTDPFGNAKSIVKGFTLWQEQETRENTKLWEEGTASLDINSKDTVFTSSADDKWSEV